MTYGKGIKKTSPKRRIMQQPRLACGSSSHAPPPPQQQQKGSLVTKAFHNFMII
jgi:hypothetical protein